MTLQDVWIWLTQRVTLVEYLMFFGLLAVALTLLGGLAALGEKLSAPSDVAPRPFTGNKRAFALYVVLVLVGIVIVSFFLGRSD